MGQLPKDLVSVKQIEVLKLPSSVESLDWIAREANFADRLKTLDASNSAVEAISRIPSRLERLNLRAANRLARLPPIPPSVRELDISFTAIEDLRELPRTLESLTLGGPHVHTLEGLPDSLLHLTLENVPNLRSCIGLPRSLQSLSITDAALQDLIGLPEHLKFLTLVKTQIRTLRDLPTTLQMIKLAQNKKMEAELPPFLLSLTLDGSQRKVVPQQPPFLNELDLEKLPFLNELDLQGIKPKSLPHFIRRIKIDFRLGASQAPPSDVPAEGNANLDLPRGLVELDWQGEEPLPNLPSSLRTLVIHSPRGLADIAFVPPTLGLIVHIDKGTLHRVPQNLHQLSWRFYPNRRISKMIGEMRSVKNLKLAGSPRLEIIDGLPKSLESLDISETAVSHLQSLPDSLATLNISNTCISRLRDLPDGLISLTVHAGQLDTLSGLPPSVTRLYFVDRNPKSSECQ